MSKISKNLLYNDNLMKIFSLLIAILFWFIVVINVSPDYKRTLLGVQVNFTQNNSVLTSVGLHIVDKSATRVSIEVSGPRNIIGRLDSDDIVVTPVISDITKKGKYNVELNAALKSPDNRIRITKINPSYININLDTVIAKTLPVEVQVKNYTVPDGYLMQTAQTDPDQITVSGPTSELSKVTKAVAYVNIKNGTAKTTTYTSDIVLLGADGKQLDLDHMQLSNNNVQVTIPILKTANVPLAVNFTNVPAGFSTSNISSTFSPSSITIAGDEDKVNSISEISLGNIDFTKLNITNKLTLNVPSIDGIVNVGNVTKVNVAVTLKNTSSRLISTGNFSVINVPTGYKVKNKTDQLYNIRLFGPASDIGNISDVTAIINMSGAPNGTGQFEVPVSFEIQGKSGFWITGNYTAIVYVSKQ